MEQAEYQPKSILYRNQDFTQYVSAGMGISDFDTFFGNEMAKNEFIIKFVNQIKIAIKEGVCKIPDDYIFPHTYVERLDKIWNGTCYYGINKRPFVRKFLYDIPSKSQHVVTNIEKIQVGVKKSGVLGYVCRKCNVKFTGDVDFDVLSAHLMVEHGLQTPTTVSVGFEFKKITNDIPIYEEKPITNYYSERYDELIQLPKFRNMIPVGKIADETLLIQVREAIPIKYAFEGSSYATLLSDGNLIHAMSDGMMPKFSQEDMHSLVKKSYFYTRPVFNSLMEDFEYFFNDNWNHVSVSLQKIIDHSGLGLNLSDEYENSQIMGAISDE